MTKNIQRFRWNEEDLAAIDEDNDVKRRDPHEDEKAALKVLLDTMNEGDQKA